MLVVSLYFPQRKSTHTYLIPNKKYEYYKLNYPESHKQKLINYKAKNVQITMPNNAGAAVGYRCSERKTHLWPLKQEGSDPPLPVLPPRPSLDSSQPLSAIVDCGSWNPCVKLPLISLEKVSENRQEVTAGLTALLITTSLAWPE